MTERLNEYTTELALESYRRLIPGFWMSAIALLVFSLGIGLLAFVMAKDKKSEAGKALSASFLVSMVVVLFQLFYMYFLPGTVLAKIGLFLLLVIGISSIILCAKGMVFGFVLAIAHLYVGWVIYAVCNLKWVYADYRRIEDLEVYSRVPSGVSSDVLLMSVLMLELIVGAVSAWIIGKLRQYYNGVEVKETTVEDRVKKLVGNIVDNPAKNSLKKVAAGAIVLIVVIIPMFSSNLVGYVTDGGAELNNVFVSCITDYYSNPDIINDGGYFERLQDSYEEMIELNCRVFHVNTRRVRSQDVSYLVRQSIASYQQILAIEQIEASVRENDMEGTVWNGKYFDYTNQLMSEAMLLALDHNAEWNSNKIRSFWYIMIDVFRFYTSFLSLKVFALIMTGISLLLFFGVYVSRAGLSGGREMFLTGLFRPLDVLKMPKIEPVIMSIAIVIIVVIGVFISHFGKDTSSANGYAEQVSEAFQVKAATVMECLASDVSGFEQPSAELVEALSQQEDAIDMFLALENVDQEYLEFHSAVREKAVYLSQLIEQFRQNMAQDADGALKKELYEAELEMMQITYKIYLIMLENSVADML